VPESNNTESPRRVALVAGFAESLTWFRGDLITAILATGARVHAIAPMLTTNAEVSVKLRAWGCELHDLPLQRTGLNPLEDVRALAWLISFFRTHHVDVVFAWAIKPVVYGMLAAAFGRVQTRVALITGLGYAFLSETTGTTALVQWLAKTLYRAALSRATTAVFQNPDDRALFCRLRLVNPAIAEVVNGSGIALDRYPQCPPPQAGPLRFLLIGRLLRDKGVHEYVEAARIVRGRHPGTTFHLVGWIDSNPAAIRQQDLSAWIAEGVVEYHGKVEDVRPLLESAHVYVLPSYSEGTPRTVLEALATGRAIVTTDVPGCRETVVQDQNGFLVPARNAAALAEAMERFVLDTSLVGRMGAASRHLAETKYDVKAVNRALLGYMGLAR
jgi:glycosyltransferase involved in cell wall biosynthesis